MRGDPHEVFRPREGGLTRIRCFSVVVVGLQKTKKKSKSGKIDIRERTRRPEILKKLKSRRIDIHERTSDQKLKKSRFPKIFEKMSNE